MRCDTVSIFCYRRAPLQDCVLELLVCLATAQEPPQLGFLHLLLQYQVLKDTLPLARTLLNLSCDWPPGMQLGLDMLHRLEDWDGLASGLLRSGRVLEACRVCDTRDLSPNRFEFLRAASAESNEVFYEVYYWLRQINSRERNGNEDFTIDDKCEQYIAEWRERFTDTSEILIA